MRVLLNRRNVVLGALLVATLALSAWTLLNGPDDTVVEPAARPGKVAGAATNASPGGAANVSPGASTGASTDTSANASANALANASSGKSAGAVPAPSGSVASGGAAAATEPRRASAGALPAPGAGPWSLAPRPGPPAAITNLFGAYSYQAPSAVAAAPAPPRPHAPPLPFIYTGHLEIDGQDTYLFLQGDAPISATVGTVIGEFTLVEARGQTLVFLHGPSGERVPLSIAAVGG
jgi:hypothetical protein